VWKLLKAIRVQLNVFEPDHAGEMSMVRPFVELFIPVLFV
jgi:hypothetical protein